MTTILTLATLASATQSTNIAAYIQPAFHDAAFTAKVVQKDEKELQKINDDFGQGYRFNSTSVRMKEPYKLRLDANVEDTTVTYVVNGAARRFKVPRLRVNHTDDLTRKPGNRQTVMDFGVLTPVLFTDFLDASFVRIDRATANAVFDLTYKPVFKDKTRYRVWLDPKTRLIVKREWYHRKGRFVATFYYDAPVNEGGAWMPTKLTVKNAEDKVAGITRYDGVRINQGIADDVFRL